MSYEEDGLVCCLRCGHEIDAHDVYGQRGQRDLLFCTVKGCHCELLEGEA